MRNWCARHPIYFMGLYALFYLTFFALLERTIQTPDLWVHCRLDDLIPFCKWFVIPYAFWFLFVGGMLLYTLFYNIPAFRRMMWFIILTYSFALVTYLLFPNCQHLRPTLLGGDLLTRFTAKLYAADTNTNVCPSIHVIGSFAVYFAARDIRRFRAKGWRLGFLTMAVLISLSTVFLKQHSVLDVLAGLAAPQPIP